MQAAPVKETIEAEGRNIVIGAFAPLASFAMFHMVTVFPLSWVCLFTNQTPAKFLVIELVSAVFGVVAMVASGVARQSHRPHPRLLSITAAAIAAFSGFAPQLLNTGDVGEASFMILGFILLGSFVRTGLGHDRVEFRADLPLYRLGADVGSCVAVRRRICALRRARCLQPFRGHRLRRLSALGRDRDGAGARHQSPA